MRCRLAWLWGLVLRTPFVSDYHEFHLSEGSSYKVTLHCDRWFVNRSKLNIICSETKPDRRIHLRRTWR